MAFWRWRTLQVEKEMLKGYIDIIILSFLDSQDLYGYELGKQVKERTRNTFELKEGTLYLAFKRMEKNGWVQSYWGEEGNGGRRRHYRILPEGKKLLRNKKREWEHIKTLMDIFLEGVE